MKKDRCPSDGTWFLSFFRKSLAMRKGRVAIASVSVMFAVSVITAMAVITTGINTRLGEELSAYGANLIVSPGETGRLDEEAIRSILNTEHVLDVSGQILTQVYVRDQAVEVIGTEVSSLRNMGWRLSGKWPEMPYEALAGVTLMHAAGLNPGKSLSVRGSAGEREYVITGSVERGGFEDSALIMSLENARYLTRELDAYSAILVRGDPDHLEGIVAEISRTVAGSVVKTIRQVAGAEKSLLEKMKLLMLLVTAVILLASGICVGSTMGASVLERREEIGLMKSIGATRRQIRLFFMSESAFIGIIGGAAGFIAGAGAAQAIAKGAFDATLPVTFYIPVVSIASALVLSLCAGYFPVRNALKYNPAVILREE